MLTYPQAMWMLLLASSRAGNNRVGSRRDDAPASRRPYPASIALWLPVVER